MRCSKFSARIFGETDMGMVRKNNEDTFVCQNVWDSDHLLCAAIDGLGGYEGGEVAADIAGNVIIRTMEESAPGNFGQLLRKALVDANNEIVNQRKASPKISHMGCVASVGLIDLRQGVIYVGHVGDSRIYQFSEGKLIKLTHDHSLVGYREERGEMTEEAAMHHPKRNEIERFLGERQLSEHVEDYIEISVFPIPGKCQYLFCSDGLTDLITSARISGVLSTDNSPEVKTAQLIADANNAGGKDNITVVIAELTPDESGNSSGCLDEMRTPNSPVSASVSPAGDDNAELRSERISFNQPSGYERARVIVRRPSRLWYLLWFIVGAIVGGVASLGFMKLTEDISRTEPIPVDTAIGASDSISDTVNFEQDSISGAGGIRDTIGYQNM